MPRIGISSTEIRRRVQMQEPITYLVPDAVASYIDEHRLYGGRTPVMKPEEIALAIAELASDRKAVDIVQLDLRGLTSLADYFVICTGRSDRQVKAIHDAHPPRHEERARHPADAGRRGHPGDSGC